MLHDAQKAIMSLRKPDSVGKRSERVLRLKEELNRILALVVHSRESLENELDSEFAQKKYSIDNNFLKKLKELTACYGTLTDARIRLDKSEKALEREMTPEEEEAAVREYIMEKSTDDRRLFLRNMVEAHMRGITKAAPFFDKFLAESADG